MIPSAGVIATGIPGETGSAPEAAVLEQRFVGAEPGTALVGLDPLPSNSHYFLGREPSRWRRNVPHYSRIAYRNICPSVDLIYYGAEGSLEYDFMVVPGADATAIRLTFAGADGIALDSDGNVYVTVETCSTDLPLQTPSGMRSAATGMPSSPSSLSPSPR